MMEGTRLVLLCLIAAGLSGCTVISGKGLEEAAVDKSLTTASIPPIDPAVAAETLSDSRTVRNAVSAANIATVDAAPLAWQNADTGASGTITAIKETRAGDAVCRQFTTSRQRFDGVALYAGEACTTGQGEWTLTRFSEDR
ncbi:RT0821/Lpp0805 family surface protein [uncultured Aureimonas sp.]|uniref:RT0821/Lpp0805 family surface protein n=1 Tax=uncultured Aureimonas sp. TaxID=1604662 RepID=UPI0025F71FB6|nr:RT0821/Lpp0805 family surface protein [uncultured Aureimonas sp.]